MQHTEPADRFIVENDSRALPRSQRRVFSRREAILSRVLRQLQQNFDVALDVVEIDAATISVPGARQHASGCETRENIDLFGSFHELGAVLEQSQIVDLPPKIALRRQEQTWPERASHDGEITGDRIGQLELRNARIDELCDMGIDEAVSDDFLVPAIDQSVDDDASSEAAPMCVSFDAAVTGIRS